MPNVSVAILAVLSFATQGVVGFLVAPHIRERRFGFCVTSTCLLAEESSSSSDILNTPTFLKKKIEVLKTDIANAEASVESLKAQVEEGKKEWGDKFTTLENEARVIQSRISEKNAQGSDDAKVAVVQKMLDVLANFDMAFGAITPTSDDDEKIQDEYKATYEMIQTTFERLGVTEVESVGAAFDYEVHEAVMMLPSADYDEGIVCQELAKGYKLGDKLIRPAQVAVVG